MIVKCDFHIHSEHSSDGKMSVGEIISAAKTMGYGAIAISDHNCFTATAEADALTSGDPDFLTIPAIEYSTERGHILALFVEREPQPEPQEAGGIGKFKFDSVVDEIHAAGGISVFAHPFRYKHNTNDLTRLKGVELVEVFNARAACKLNYNANFDAVSAAAKLGCGFSCGSDAHVPGELGNAELYLDVPELTNENLREALLQGGGTVFGRDAYATHGAISTWRKEIMLRKRWKKLPKQLAYTAYALVLDVLKSIKILKKNGRKCYVKDGVFIERDNQNRQEN